MVMNLLGEAGLLMATEYCIGSGRNRKGTQPREQLIYLNLTFERPAALFAVGVMLGKVTRGKPCVA